MSNAFFTWDDDYLQDEKMHKPFVLSPTEPYSLVEKRGKLFASMANKLTKYKLDISETNRKNVGAKTQEYCSVCYHYHA